MPSPSSIFSSSLLATNRSVLRKAAVRLGIWVVVAFPVLLAVELWFSSVPLTRFDRRLHDLADRAENIEVLVLGSSVMNEGVDPALVAPNTFNMAGPSQDLYYDTQIVVSNLERLTSLRVVVWELAPHRIGYDLSRAPTESRLIKLYDPYFPRRFGDAGPSRLHSSLNFLRVRGADPLATFVDLVSNTFSPRHEGWFPNADGFAPPRLRTEVDDVGDRVKYHSSVFAPELVDDNLTMVTAALRTLEARGVKTLIVHPPAARAYHDGLLAVIGDMVSLAQAELGAKTSATFLNLQRLVESGRGHFRNADHLQGEGTRKFSLAIADAVRPLLPADSKP